MALLENDLASDFFLNLDAPKKHSVRYLSNHWLRISHILRDYDLFSIDK